MRERKDTQKDSTNAKKIEDQTKDNVEPPNDECKPVDYTCYACNKHGHISRNYTEVRPFNGYCYSCNKFGHRAMNCKTSQKNKTQYNQINQN